MILPIIDPYYDFRHYVLDKLGVMHEMINGQYLRYS